jgi:hypothetical protein
MFDLRLLLRGGDSYSLYDDKGVPSTVGGSGNLAATATTSALDLTASLRQLPVDGAAIFTHLPGSSVTTTGGPTNFTLRQTVEMSEDNTNWRNSLVSQLLTFAVTSNAATAFTYDKDAVQTTVNLPCVLKQNLPFADYRYVRLTYTIAFTGGSSPALDATGLGKVLSYVDNVDAIQLPWADIT